MVRYALAITQRHGNNAGRASTPHFALIKREENLHRFLPLPQCKIIYEL